MLKRIEALTISARVRTYKKRETGKQPLELQGHANIQISNPILNGKGLFQCIVLSSILMNVRLASQG